MVLNVNRNRGRWLKCCFTSTETVGLLGTGAQDVYLDFHTASKLCLRTERLAYILWAAIAPALQLLGVLLAAVVFLLSRWKTIFVFFISTQGS